MHGTRSHRVCRQSLHQVRRRTGVRDRQQARGAHRGSATGPGQPAGTYTRNNWPLLSFSDFLERHGGIILVAAAGNDSTNRRFWPAAFPRPSTIAVGALGADHQNLAYFSNYGSWVDVYAPGEGLVNAFATGVYTYQEPPKRPTKQIFTGMARWDGTSFSAPLVAGLIADDVSHSGRSAADAAAHVLGTAQVINGVGPALIP